jgi:hypothetical protein
VGVLMIIGISGVAGSGKDTVADFIVKERKGCKISFADPLKRFCGAVFEWSEEQLWGPSDKRNAIDNRYTDLMMWKKAETNFYENALVWLNDVGISSTKMNKLEIWFENLFTLAYKDGGLSPRKALQTLGTEFGRSVNENVWVDYAINISKKILNNYDMSYSRTRGAYCNRENDIDFISNFDSPLNLNFNSTPQYETIVIPDFRFKNEVMAARQNDIELIRVKRPNAGLDGSIGQHKSEQEQLNIPDSLFNTIITNDGTLEDLYTIVSALL